MPESMPLPDLSKNQSFSPSLVGFQYGIDSTSLGEFKTCPRKYYYSIIWGFQPRSQSVHITFGLLLHEAIAKYNIAKIKSGLNHEDALREVIRWALRKTWNSELKRPWISDDPTKNRLTLLRTIVWYLDHYENEAVETIKFANGNPAVEVSFAIAINQGILCGHFDRAIEMNGHIYGLDTKTTKHALDASFFSSFSPDNQITLYSVAGQMVFRKPISGFVIDGVQVGTTFARFARGIAPRPNGTLDEWLAEFDWWVGEMERCATDRYWPMNDKSCNQYGGCQFRAVCSRAPNAREQWLKTDYIRRVWDPLVKRQEV